MAKLDPGRLIRQTRRLIAESKKLHDLSRHAVATSKDLEKDVQLLVSTSRHLRRKRPLKKSA